MYIAIDIGGTKITLASFDSTDPQTQIKEITIPTPDSYQDCLRGIKEHLENLSEGKPIRGIGVSYASSMDEEGTIVMASNLPDYKGKNLKQDLLSQHNVPVVVKNDAECAARAEMTFGHGRLVKKLTHVIVGTGFGGAMAVRLGKEVVSFSMEPGLHVVDSTKNQPQNPHNPGKLESFVSGQAVMNNVHEEADTLPDNHPSWYDFSRALSIGLYNLIVITKPEIITFSGSVITKRPFLLQMAKQELDQYTEIPIRPQLVLTEFPNPCLLGALSLLI
jgi:glucokinase